MSKKKKNKERETFMSDVDIIQYNIDIDESQIEDYSSKVNKASYHKHTKGHNRQRVKRKLKAYEVDINYELEEEEIDNLME